MSVSNPSTPKKPKLRMAAAVGARRRSSRAIAAIATIALASVALVMGAPAAQAANPTVVTLTFDDGNADQLNAAQIMKAQGMVGTFFITSGFTDNPGYMSVANLQGLVADGNEIGGHTVTHPDLITLPADEAKRQICNDRINLSNWGFSVTNFAYPFASENAATETIAQGCGFNSARGLGDIKTRFSCPACGLAETMPPANAYNTAAPDEVIPPGRWPICRLRSPRRRRRAAGFS